ncbi:hypothetical protein SK128_004466 [Halocaridina rubra]|uniref:C2H2-type domain-containing protein n=1 Tax=Halocaridina rubra TaxID=373956 RepID=A0AAN8WV94_HALRR
MEDRVQNIYQCAICLKEFSRKSTCKSHMKLHTGERPHECVTCGMTFASKSNLNTHILTHTYQKCTVCGKTFTSKPLLKSHMVMHSSERPHECDLCGRCFKRKGELRSHQFTHTGEKRWKCQVCGNHFTERHSLKTHMRIHTGEKPFKCSVCGKSFARKSSYTGHSRIHTGIQPYKCFVCGKKFHHRAVMVSHSKKHMIKECIMCNANFMKECELTAHIKDQHHEDWPYRCDLCGTLFTESAKVKKHMRLHTETKPFQCHICTKQFLHKSGLQTHLFTHSETEDRPTCEICGKSFTAKISLDIHMRSHTGEKPFMCSFCGKQFTRKSGCLSHMRLHTGEKPYLCKKCGKRFAYSSGLRSHMNMHNKAVCTLCGVKLIGGIDPSKHVTRRISAIGVKCYICDIEFKSVSLFKHHLYKHEVNEREEQCLKNTESLGIERNADTEGYEEKDEDDPVHETDLGVFVEDETVDKKLDLPEMAMLEAFPNQDGLSLTTGLKSLGRKSDALNPSKLLQVKQEAQDFNDAEFFNMAVLEVTKSDDPSRSVPSFKVTTHQHEMLHLENNLQNSSLSQDFDDHSQDIDFDESVTVSPLRDIDPLEASLSSSELSNPLNNMKIMEPVSTISLQSVSEIITINALGDKDCSSVRVPNTSNTLTISTSSPSKDPSLTVANPSKSFKFKMSSQSVVLPKSERTSSLAESSAIKAITTVTSINSKSPLKTVSSSNANNASIVKPVYKVKSGIRKRYSAKANQVTTNTSKGILHPLPEFPQPPKLFAEKDVDLASSYSSYVKEILSVIKPADKQLALIKSLNNTMDNFIEKYKLWK